MHFNSNTFKLIINQLEALIKKRQIIGVFIDSCSLSNFGNVFAMSDRTVGKIIQYF